MERTAENTYDKDGHLHPDYMEFGLGIERDSNGSGANILGFSFGLRKINADKKNGKTQYHGGEELHEGSLAYRTDFSKKFISLMPKQQADVGKGGVLDFGIVRPKLFDRNGKQLEFDPFYKEEIVDDATEKAVGIVTDINQVIDKVEKGEWTIGGFDVVPGALQEDIKRQYKGIQSAFIGASVTMEEGAHDPRGFFVEAFNSDEQIPDRNDTEQKNEKVAGVKYSVKDLYEKDLTPTEVFDNVRTMVKTKEAQIELLKNASPEQRNKYYSQQAKLAAEGKIGQADLIAPL